jgi:exodeoxyribonuclease-1
MLYHGFLGDADRALCEEVRKARPAQLAQRTFPFSDPRLQELLFRYRARNYPESLSTDERAQWREHCQIQWREGTFSRENFERALAAERADPAITSETQAALVRLEEWVTDLSVEQPTALQ